MSVSYATSNGTAVAGTDYTAASGTLSWAAGDSTAKTISVTVIDEQLTSGSKTFGVTLSAPTGGATLGTPSTATVTIADNDVVPGTIQLSASSYSTSESAGTVTLSVSRTGGSSGAVSVSYATSNGTAVAGTDYTASSGTLSWAAGDSTAKTISVPVTDEQLTSGSKTFGVTLSAPTGGATLGTTSTATVTITNNDVVPGTLAFSISSYSVNEAAGTVTLQVTRTGGSSGAATVSYATVSGTATAGTAYTTTTGTLSWADGDSSSKSIAVPILNPGITAGSQSFMVDLSGATGAALGGPTTATVTINDNDVVVADCSAYSYSGDQHLCQINSVAAPNAIAVRVSPTANSANQPIVVLPANSSGIAVYLSVITTKYFAPATYSWSQVPPVIDSYASKATAAFSNTTTATPQVTVLLPASGIYQFQVTATDINNKELSTYVWVNVWDPKPAISPGNIGLNPGIAPPASVAMLSADPGPFKHPRLLFSAGDWATLSAKADADTGTPEVLAGLAELRSSMSKNFDNPGTAMNKLEAALLQYEADGYPSADYSAICTLIGFTPGSTAGTPPSAVVPDILVSARDSALGTDPDSYFSDGLAAASYLAWLAVDPTQPSDPASAGTKRLVQLGTMTAALSQFLLTTELAYPAVYTGSNSGTLANYSLAMAYDLTYNAMTTEQQATTRDYLYTIGNLYDTQGGGIGLYSAEPKNVPPSTSQNGVDFPNLADGLDSPALVIEGEEDKLSSTVTGNLAFGTYIAAASSADPNVTPVSSWPYANQASVRNLERQIRANSEYILTPWGFYHTMEGYFELGQNVSAVGTYAYARRGENQWVSTYLYQALMQVLYNIVPEQNSSGLEQILDHQDGSGFAGGGAQRNFYYLSKAMYPDDPMIDYVYRQATVGNGDNALARAIFGQLLQTSDLDNVAQAKQLGLTKFDPLVGFAISRNGWKQDDLSLVMMNFTLGNGHYHAEANSFTLSALGRVWSNPPQYHVVPGDAQQQISILTYPGATDASQGYIGQGPSSYDYLHNQSTGGPFHGVLLEVSEDPNGLWTWFAGDSKPAYDWVGGTVTAEDGTTVDPVETGLTNSYMLIPGLTDVLIPSDTALLNSSTEFARATPYNPVLYSFRSILTVRGTHPYVLVIDDMNKDGLMHNYRWSMNNSIGFGGSGGVFLNQSGDGVYASLQIQPGASPTDATLYHTIDAANTTGQPRLLVRDVTEQSAIAQPAISIDDRPIPSTGATSETNLTYGVDNNTHKFTYFPSRRLFVDRDNVIEPKYKILLFPYGVGDTLPITSWNSTFSTLTVKVGTQVDTITFDSTQPDHRTRLLSFTRSN